MAANIFISFASQDLKTATVLCNALEARGFECWISARNILPGENFQVAIVQAIRRSKIMLLVFTENSNRSEEMTKELALASQQKLIVIPLRVEDVTPNEAFSYEFATRQWIDCFADWEFAMDQLSQRISNAIGSAEAAAVQAAPEPEPPPVVAELAPPAPAPAPVAAVQPPPPGPAPGPGPGPANDAAPAPTGRPFPLRRVAIAAVILAAIGLGVGLGLPALKRPAAPEAKTVMLAVATAQPADAAAPPPAVVAEPAKVEEEAKPAPKPAKRKAPKATHPSIEDIPF